MPNINIKVADKIATNMSPDVSIICGNADYTVTFDFDEEWSAHPVKTARFVFTKSGKLQYLETAFSGNVAQVPVLSGIDAVYVGVYAGELHTTTPTRVLCKRSILCGGGTHEEPAEDVYLQILELLSSGDIGGGVSSWNDLTDRPFVESTEYPGCYYREVTTTVEHGTITEKEWLNPPMRKYGVPYRTTKRFSGSPVYAMQINIGEPTSNSTKDVTAETEFQTVGSMDYVLYPSRITKTDFLCSDMDTVRTMWDGVSGYAWSNGGGFWVRLKSTVTFEEYSYPCAELYLEFTAYWVY